MPISSFKRGFTLIELLVVIAIIGVLAGIIISSLSGSRVKAQDTKVKAQLHGLRQQAELTHSDLGAYGVSDPADVDCPNTPDSLPAVLKIQELLATLPPGTTIKCAVTSGDHNDFAVMASLAGGDPGDYWCIDSANFEDQINVTDPSAVVLDDDSCAKLDAR